MSRTHLIAFAKKLTGTVAATLILVSVASSADTQSPFVGKWVVDIARSTFEPAQPPKSNTVTVTEVSGGGLHTVVEIVEADGSNTHMEYTIPLGGTKATPVSGTEYADSISATYPSARTIKYSLSKSGAVIETGTLTVSKSGSTMQGTLSGTYQNVPWKDHFVYHRQ